MINLEPLAASAAERMLAERQGADAKEADILITKALMVLAEQGVYALGMFLASRKRPQDQAVADNVHAALKTLLEKAQLGKLSNGLSPEEYASLVKSAPKESDAQAFQRLLMTANLMETALTYGRYQAKSRNAGKND
jgi:hypothetical protein